jgi:hypothetical protein
LAVMGHSRDFRQVGGHWPARGNSGSIYIAKLDLPPQVRNPPSHLRAAPPHG